MLGLNQQVQQERPWGIEASLAPLTTHRAEAAQVLSHLSDAHSSCGPNGHVDPKPPLAFEVEINLQGRTLLQGLTAAVTS